MDFKKYLSSNANSLDQEIEQILTNFLHQVEKINVKLVPFALGLISSCKGGKRIRGTLVKLGYEIATSPSTVMVQGPRNDEVIKIGAAYEILHAAILIHDDILDQSELRRGKLTLYRILGGDHYGISQALMLGDIGLFLPIKLIADSHLLGEYKNKALSFFAQTIINTAWGEVLDVELPYLRGQGTGDSEQREEDVIAIHSLKTAQYTISGPLILGAILGGGDKGLLGELGKFGDSLGIAFQIQDDILGVFGDEKELGKSVTSDIEEGKNTLLITEALKRANPKQRQILDKYYGRGNMGNLGDKGNQGLEEVRRVFLETGSLDYSRQEGVKYVNQAKKYISKITKYRQLSGILYEMADFLVERSK